MDAPLFAYDKVDLPFRTAYSDRLARKLIRKRVRVRKTWGRPYTGIAQRLFWGRNECWNVAIYVKRGDMRYEPVSCVEPVK